jgi:hypothetical protein
MGVLSKPRISFSPEYLTPTAVMMQIRVACKPTMSFAQAASRNRY